MDAPPLTKATVNALDFEDLVTVVTLLGHVKQSLRQGRSQWLREEVCVTAESETPSVCSVM